MERYSRVYETVNLDAIRQNMEAMRANLKEGTEMIGVVKADGYGHGSVPVACAIDSYVSGYATATPEEAVILRKHGITKPILILGVSPESSFSQLIEYDLRPAIFRYESAERLSELAVQAGKRASIHIALDTGMSRIGYMVTAAAADETARISRLPGIRIEGLFTHFARADEKDKGATDRQMELFATFVSMLSERGVTIPVLHCSNSAGILELPKANFNAVRAGISIYGLYPSDEVEKEQVRLIPAMELKSTITYLKTIAPGTPVSYGGTFTAERETSIATIPVGYGDGYPRALSGRADVLIRGRRARILGRVCMDQLMVDTTDIPEVEKEQVRLIPAMELKSTITYLKTIAPGTPVSYGGTFTAERETSIATIPVGYGDGYPRALSGRADVLIRGRRARILGRVCMDQLMVDTTDIPEAEEGDEVTLIGKDGEEEITVEELARIGGGFHYEILCDIGKRVPRVYIEAGKVVGKKDYFDDIYEGFGK